MNPKILNFEHYISTIPSTHRYSLQELRDLILKSADQVEEYISTGVPEFKYNGRYLVSLGAAKSHISLYVMQGTALEAIQKKLKAFDVSNKVIRFTPETKLPIGIIKEIIKKRIQEIRNEGKKTKTPNSARF